LYYTTLINNIAEEIGVNANLLHAIIQVESAYNPSATSSKGAQGLMQLIPATAERFGVDHSYDPAANVRGGARYVKNLLVRFDNNLQLALAAYNAGEGTVQKYNNTIPPYPETQAYVTRVLSLFAQREE
jgi:soluble lytic murein transglycosylase-like protein